MLWYWTWSWSDDHDKDEHRWWRLHKMFKTFQDCIAWWWKQYLSTIVNVISMSSFFALWPPTCQVVTSQSRKAPVTFMAYLRCYCYCILSISFRSSLSKLYSWRAHFGWMVNFRQLEMNEESRVSVSVLVYHSAPWSRTAVGCGRTMSHQSAPRVTSTTSIDTMAQYNLDNGIM